MTSTKPKFFLIPIFPLVGAIYFIISLFTSLPHTRLVLGIIMILLCLFWLNYLLTKPRYAGSILISENMEKKLYSLELNCEPEEIESRLEVLFKVEKNPR